MNCDVVIIGGGIAGLCTAYYLLKAGQRVTLIEKDQVGRAASWAGGGILSPLRPWAYSDWHHELTDQSLSCLDEITATLHRAGLHFERNYSGMLYLNEPKSDKLLAWLNKSNAQFHWLENQELRRLLESLELHSLSSIAQSAVWAPSVSNIRNPQYIQALKTYLQQQPKFSLMEHTRASIIFDQSAEPEAISQVRGIEINQVSGHQVIQCERVIITAGPWSSTLLTAIDSNSQQLQSVQPIRGQMIAYRPQLPLKTIIMHQDHYIIPRADGLILVGSTLERVGFDQGVTATAEAALMTFAVSILPELTGQKPLHHWSGLRPVITGQEGIPFIGQIAGTQGLWMNTGHFRNGIVHAPGSADRLVRAMIKAQELKPVVAQSIRPIPVF